MKTNKMTCVPSRDSDQPRHRLSLIGLHFVEPGLANDPILLQGDSEDSVRDA